MKFLKGSIGPALLWTGLIFYLLSMDTSGAAELSLLKIYGIDKLIHFALFGILAYLLVTYFLSPATKHPNQTIWMIIILSSTYGMGMEYYQQYFTNRSFSYWDGVADALGSVAGALAVKKSPYGNRGRNQN
ncbi:MAG: VanZ family protein [Bacteroidota bacterium]|jgi:VanZ family protein